jgi:hydroxypyruvate reductase
VRGPRGVGADLRRALLLRLYAAASAAVEGRGAVARALAGPASEEPLSLIAIGKAAGSMALGACDVHGRRIRRGIVISRAGHLDAELAGWPALQCLEGDHPVPGAGSLAAGAALEAFIAATPPGSRVLVLVSGGASSLVESLPAGVTATELARLNEWGLGSGLPITALNDLRRRVSRLKGGRLARLLEGHRAEALLISDVPGDDPAVIGSGLVAAGPAGPLPPGLPGWVRELVTAEHGLPAGATLPSRVIARLEDACLAVEQLADEQGLGCRRIPTRADGEVEPAANRFAHELALGTDDVLVWGGETTVRLPPVPGRGGRNQQFALAAARLLAGHGELLILAAGTDGSDGNSDDAGAIVDGGTIARGRAAGLDPDAALAAADAGPFLEASGDLLYTGPTGTNVGDLMVGLRRTPLPPDDEEPAGVPAQGKEA